MGKTEGALKIKSYSFAIRIVRLAQFLQESKEYVLSRQILKSGTSIGALVREADFLRARLTLYIK